MNGMLNPWHRFCFKIPLNSTESDNLISRSEENQILKNKPADLSIMG
jgi:hypothetical protein